MVKLTKTELRTQQVRLAQLQKYLPTLHLKKMLLQLEVSTVDQELEELSRLLTSSKKKVEQFSLLFSAKNSFDFFPALKVVETQKRYENIAGVDVPVLEDIVFQEASYFMFDSPVWLDAAIDQMRDLVEVEIKIKLAHEKREALAKELRSVSIRVNLFEKILIPRAQGNIKKIKIFLGDQQLAAVCQAKVSKKKILVREELYDR